MCGAYLRQLTPSINRNPDSYIQTGSDRCGWAVITSPIFCGKGTFNFQCSSSAHPIRFLAICNNEWSYLPWPLVSRQPYPNYRTRCFCRISLCRNTQSCQSRGVADSVAEDRFQNRFETEGVYTSGDTTKLCSRVVPSLNFSTSVRSWWGKTWKFTGLNNVLRFLPFTWRMREASKSSVCCVFIWR